ncbi:hypothetical protein QBC38DRAFT_424511 [Podospora fimiseda]|uniref:Uncharacterized protein n=1 Tax=Podospora fimiseda TaxID=252190 RepID=A0AAN7BIM7_9PEZI|nr:hypothetical protein QBC38DRAFT_424511 [Podospora fimiseda]
MGHGTPPPSAQRTETPQQPKFRRLWKTKDDPQRTRRTTHFSATELTAWCGRDLDILIAPLDGYYADTQDDYETLVNLYHIPTEFIAERDRSVTHSFGRHLEDGGMETLWMHFLSEVPSTDPSNPHPDWLKWAFILEWHPVTSESTTTYAVSLIVFQPPAETLKLLVQLLQSPNWTDVTIDPYILVNLSLSSWHERIEQVAWDVKDLVRTDETDIFRRAQSVRSTKVTTSDLNLHRLHTNAKNAIFMVEALDAIIRSADLALSDHASFPSHTGYQHVWENTHRRLQHTSELFHSSRLMTASVQARIKNTIDLAFHINTVHDSQVNIDNSRSVRIISIVGMVFIPFSAVSSIFGTQFFSTPDETAGHMAVNSDFWMLWVIALPLTLVIVGMWRWSEYKSMELQDDVGLLSFGWDWLQGQRKRRKGRAGNLKDASTIV